MTIPRTQHFRRIYGIALSVSLVLTGLCLMVQCCRIYFTGDGTFSPEIVASHFFPIALPCFLSLGLILFGFLLDVLLPPEAAKRSTEKNYCLILEKLHSKTDLILCDDELRASIIREQKSRKCHKIVTILLLILGSFLFLLYALRPESFHQRDITPSLIQAMKWLVPSMALPFGYGIFAAYHSRASIRREIELLRSVGGNKTPVAETAPVSSGRALPIRWVILAIAVGLFLYGYVAGGTADVLTKAINICTECVGLG